MKNQLRAVVNRIRLLDGLDSEARWQETRRKLQPVLDDGDDRSCVVTVRLQRATDKARADGLFIQKGRDDLTIAVPADRSVMDEVLVEAVYNWVWGVLDEDEVAELDQLLKEIDAESQHKLPLCTALAVSQEVRAASRPPIAGIHT